MPRSPNRSSSRNSKSEGFMQLPPDGMNNRSLSPGGGRNNGEHIVNIPLTPIMTNASTGARKEGQSLDPGVLKDESEGSDFQRGRRRARDEAIAEDTGALTTMGRFYEKILNFSILTRYLFYILPLGLFFMIFILIGVTRSKDNQWYVGGVPIQWFFVWLEVVWCSLWVSKLLAKILPWIFRTLIGVVSSGVKKYSLIIKALEFPLSLVGWSVCSTATFLPLMTRYPHKGDEDQTQKPWQTILQKVLISCLIATIIILAEKLLIQIISVDYHRRQFHDRIKANKNNVRFLSQLYEVSRNLFPVYTEFAEEDYIIHQGLAGSMNLPGFNSKQSGSATPMRQLIGNINLVQDKVTGVFGNIAQEVTGNKNVFNPNSAYAIVLEALSRKNSTEALGKRIWMSFVPENQSVLTKEDLLEVMGQEHALQAEDCFQSLDRDGNGDVSLEEMVTYVHYLHSERSDVAKSMSDVENAIGALDNVLSFITFVIIVLVFVVAQQESVGTTLAGAGTVLISLSFVFAITAQEILGSCIFLFVKHPYDVGDRVDIDDKHYVVEHISLLYTVLRRVETQKTTQIPNNVLNTNRIENITRSKSMQEQLVIPVNFDTTFEDIQKLNAELLIFVKDNSRDFQPEIDVEVVGINKLDQLDLRIHIKHRSNWSNEAVTLQRRNKFICALVQILRKVPIYGPGAGDPSIGEQGKPMYTVAVSDELARQQMERAKGEKLAKRWDHENGNGSDSEDGDAFDTDNPPFGPAAVSGMSVDLNASGHRGRSPFSDRNSRDDGMSNPHRKSTESRDLEEVRGMLSHTLSQQGRRKPSTQVGSIPGTLAGQGLQR